MAGKQNNRAASVLLKVCVTLALAATVLFIFYNSSRIGEASSGTSQRVTALMNRVLSGSGVVLTELFVRKLGHFAEFALLGLVMTLTLRVYTKRVAAFVAWPLLFGLCTAVADEFLQQFVPGRSSSVADVVLDFVGVVAGLLLGLCVLLVAKGIAAAWRSRKKSDFSKRTNGP